jgi:hypothetical protein
MKPLNRSDPAHFDHQRSNSVDGITVSSSSKSVVSVARRVFIGLATTVLVSATLGLGAGTAHAYPNGPYQWCPGEQTRRNLDWDQSVCHTYWIVQHGQGNVGGTAIVADGTPLANIWEGDNPPASAPPPNLPPGLCRSEFPPQTCDAWGL